MPLPFVSLAFLVRSIAAGTAGAPSAPRHRRRHVATLALAACTAAAVHGAALAHEAFPCDLSNGHGLMPDESTSAWQCDTAETRETTAVPTAPASDGRADARLMLIVGVSSGAGWLARGLHRE